MLDEPFSETTHEIAARSGCNPSLVRIYARNGWIESRMLGNGMRLFKPSVSERVRAIRAERIARRGRYPRNTRSAVPA